MSEDFFQRIAVLGPGLIGGSVLHAVRDRVPGVELTAWARRAETVEQLRSAPGLVDVATESLDEAVEGADCVILAMPTGAMASVVERIGRFAAERPVLVTDVGSVKGSVQREIEPLVRERGGRFIGSHPMAGSENAGLEHAEADLFVEAVVIMIDEDGASAGDPLFALLRHFWEVLGSRVSVTTSDEHDRIVASISHLPHLVAAALVRAVLGRDAGVGAFSGGGFRDTTRVSAGPDEMWAGILSDNREAVLAELERYLGELESWKEALATLDRDRLRGFLSEARELRRSL